MKQINNNTNNNEQANKDDICIVNAKTGEHIRPVGKSIFSAFEQISKNDHNYSLFVPADIIEKTL